LRDQDYRRWASTGSDRRTCRAGWGDDDLRSPISVMSNDTRL